MDEARFAWIAPYPGRSLVWSPDWPCSDARVLFDRHSGDFWVLDAKARQLMTALESLDRLERAKLARLLDADGADGNPEGSGHALAVVAALVKARLVTAWDARGQQLSTIEPPDID